MTRDLEKGFSYDPLRDLPALPSPEPQSPEPSPDRTPPRRPSAHYDYPYDDANDLDTVAADTDNDDDAWTKHQLQNSQSPYRKLFKFPFANRSRSNSALSAFSANRSRSNSALSTLTAYSDPGALLPHAAPAKSSLHQHTDSSSSEMSSSSGSSARRRAKHLAIMAAHETLKLCRSRLFKPVLFIYAVLLVLYLNLHSLPPLPFTSPLSAPAPAADEFPLHEYSAARGPTKLARDGARYQFLWSDWKNISDQYLYSAPSYAGPPAPRTKFSASHNASTPFVLPLPSAAGSVTDMRWLAHLYLAFHAPAPAKIVYLKETPEFVVSDELAQAAVAPPDEDFWDPSRYEKRAYEDSGSAAGESQPARQHHQHQQHQQQATRPLLNETFSVAPVFDDATIIEKSRQYVGRAQTSSIVLRPARSCVGGDYDAAKTLLQRPAHQPEHRAWPHRWLKHARLYLTKMLGRCRDAAASETDRENAFLASAQCRPTPAELLRRVYVSLDVDNGLPPAYAELASSPAPPPATLDAALGDAAGRVFISDPQTAAMFNFDGAAHVAAQGPNSTLEEMVHSGSVQTALRGIATSGKFFHEAVIARGGMAWYRHMDWRFYNHEMYAEENTQAMHRLYRAWSRFADQEGILSWLAHGTLLGWYWNGLSMPFDIDMDLQMPVGELDRLARKYNNTLIVDVPGTGPDGDAGPGGRYLLEVAPAYVERESGNANNLIDARFVDTATGIYIDITGVARHPSQPDGWYACKNNHFHKMQDVFPLRRTLFQGAPAYVPSNYEVLLDKEYDAAAWRQPEFREHVFDADLRLWVPRYACEGKVEEDGNAGGARVWDEREDGLERFCGDAQLRGLYVRSRHLTKLHARELELERAVRRGQRVGSTEKRRLAHFAVRQRGVYE